MHFPINLDLIFGVPSKKKNKSNRVWTIDAFTCIHVFQLLLVIFFTCFVLLLLECSLNCLTFPFHTLTYLSFAQNRHFFMISTRLWPTDGRTDGPTDGPMDGRTHPLIEMRERI